mgnify:CR=1 FL=1
MDYKSGNVQFRLEKLYYGLSLQLAVYMEAAMQWAKEKGMERAIPAGMLYYHIDDPIVDKGGDTEVQIQKKLIMARVPHRRIRFWSHSHRASPWQDLIPFQNIPRGKHCTVPDPQGRF